MASDIGIDILNSIGANRFDVKTMAQALANAEVAAQRANIESAETKTNVKLSGYNTLSQAFNGVISEISSLTEFSSFQKQAVSSSDESVVSASISGNANNGLYQIQVEQLAKAHTLASTDFASSGTSLGTGDLNINVGGTVHTLTIGAGSDSLSGIQNSINQSDIGVNATIVNVGGAYKLMLSASKSGADNTISVSVTGDSDGNDTDAAGLSSLIDTNMTETVPAQDATMIINGLTVNSSSNNVSNVIEGVTLNLQSTDPGVIKTVEIKRDTSELEGKIGNFVEVYNALDEIIDQLGGVETDEENDAIGSLNGDSTLRGIKTQIREALIDSIPGLTGSIQSLADIGIKSKMDGSLELDSSTLQQAIASDPDAVGKLFSASAIMSDSLIKFTGASEETVEGTFNLSIDQTASQALINGASIGAGGDITIDASNSSIEVAVDGNNSAVLTLNEGTYTRDNLAKEIARVINNDSTVSGAGARVAVEYDDANTRFNVSSEKYGSASKLELISGSLLTSGAVGLSVTAETAGQDVLGSLEKDGTLYSFTGTGQHVTINSFLDGAPRGLEFDVLGGSTGARGTVEFNRGYADRLSKMFNDLMDSDDGIIGQRMSGLEDKLEGLEEKTAKVDERYTVLELRYRLQFGQLQTLLNQMDQTRTSLAASLSALQPSDS